MAGIHYVEAVDEPGLSTKPGRIHTGLNSGYQAIGFAYLWGAARIILLGYDMQRGPNGESHHHGDHEGGLPNLGTMPEWTRRMVQLGIDLRARGVEVVNATRQTAITCFERLPIDKALIPGKPPLYLQGMHGLGDNLHERAIVRKLVQTHEVWLETPWPSVFHDLPVHLVPKATALRTQAKNAKREVGQYAHGKPPAVMPQRIWYSHDQIRATGSFLGAMAANSVVKVVPADFRLPIPDAWQEKAQEWLDKWQPGKPLMIYRPLVERTEWAGCAQRNPDYAAYAQLAQIARKGRFLVSVADLEPRKEWMVGQDIGADAECHRGELDFETLAALTAQARLVFCSPGFAIILAQAVETPLVAVFGGHESARLYDHGDPRCHWIQPITPCECFSKTHACRKQIDMPRAERYLTEFLDAIADRQQIAA